MKYKKVKTRSGLTGWQGRLRDQYVGCEEFVSYSDYYRLAAKLGYNSAQEAWDANPTVQGSVNPRDYCRVLGPDEFPVVVKVTVELQVDGDSPVGEWAIRNAAEQAVSNAIRLGEMGGHVHDWASELSLGLVSVESNTG